VPPLEKADEIEAELVKRGYRRLHRSVDAGNSCVAMSVSI